jgi:S1-C subfamily serine protease
VQRDSFYQRQRTAVPAEHWDEASYANDLAVVRARVSGLTFDLNRLGDPQNLKKGDFAYAIGQPGGEQWGVTYQPGSISDVGSVWLKVQSAYVENGHSGGALIDQHGRIIGMVKQTGGSTPQALRIDRSLDVLRLDLKLPVQLAAAGELTNLARVAPTPLAPGESRANPQRRFDLQVDSVGHLPYGLFRTTRGSVVRQDQ